MRFVKGLVLFLLVVVVILAVVFGGGYLYLTRRALPQIDGTVQIPGLRAPVSIVRDKSGIPHIYAANTHDLFMAQGYVQAQDRLWQMEINRRGIAGRTSELRPTGSSLSADKFVRTLGLRRAAQADYDALDDSAKAILQAYTDGVNTFIDTHQNNLPIEFTSVGAFGSQGLNYKPEPWTPIDTLQIAKYMSWSLGGNWDVEVFRAQVLAKFGMEQGTALLSDLIPPYDYATKPIIIPAGVAWQQVPTGLASLKQIDEIAGIRGRDIGSNDWTISGSRTTTGKPLLANDPHLGIQMPSIWYFNSLHCQPVTAECPFDVTGAVFPAAPGVIIGHNARIAWGVTNVGPDVQDLFLEKIGGQQYEYQGQKLDLKIVPETWTIKGKVPDGYQPSRNETDEYDAATNTTKITLNVRYTGHGPLISDVDAVTAQLGGDQYAVAFSWTAINAPEQSLSSFMRIDQAQNWDDFRAALSVFGSPSQNFVYADVDGNIGYQVPGRIPIRAKGDGQLPVPGWTGEYDWKGYIPFDELPRSYNPTQGYIATANNAVVGPAYKYFISMDWDRGWRARRIVDLIEAKDKLSPDDIAAIQGDSLNLAAQQIVPYLADLTVDGDAQKVLTTIKNWDFFEKRDSAGAGAYEVFWLSLLRNTFDDKLGELAPTYVDGGDVNRQAMIALLGQPASAWWSNSSRDDVLKKSLADAATTLTAELGSDPASWTWSKIHSATFKSQALGDAPVSFIFNRGPFEVNGGSAIVNNTGTGSNFSKAYTNPPAKLTAIFAERTVPSLRQIVDLSDLNASRYIHTTGESGLPTSSHYDDFIDKWRNIQYVPMWWNATDIKANAEGTLTLTP
jgi:penicillin G amidase